MARVDTLGHFLTDVADAIRTKTESAATIVASNFDQEIINIPSGGGEEPEEKDVNFYDYDGTRVYSYTKNEFLQLESMPENPEHDGLTAQGWNWTFQGAKTYVTNYGFLEIGQNYKSAEEYTNKIYIELTANLSPTISLVGTGNISIDWGDGTIEQNVSATGDHQHTYSNSGKYIIKLIGNENAKPGFAGTNYDGSKILWNAQTTAGSLTKNQTYQSCVKKIIISNNNYNTNTSALSYMFSNLNSLTKLNIPTNFTELGQHTFNGNNIKCLCLADNSKIALNSLASTSVSKIILPEHIVVASNTNRWASTNNFVDVICIPEDVTAVPNNSFNSFLNLKKVILPDTITTIGQSAFYGCPSIEKIKFPSGLTSIGAQAFYNCVGFMIADFSKCSQIPTLSNSNAFTNCFGTGAKIIVPDNLYTDWIATNNWSTYSSYIVKASEA